METEFEVVGQLGPMHPGEVLREEFMAPYNLSAGAVAKACRVPRTRIERIAREEMGITSDTAIRLEKLFGSSAAFWMGLQADYDMETTRQKIAGDVDGIRLWEPRSSPTNAAAARRSVRIDRRVPRPKRKQAAA